MAVDLNAQEMTAEELRLQAANDRTENWQRWGSYLSERQWGTVREDYSANQEAWNYFPHDHARSGLIVGVKMVCWGSATVNVGSVFLLRFGTRGMTSSRSACTG